jgi:hypothetical protein
MESKELILIGQYLKGRKQSVVVDGAQSEAKLLRMVSHTVRSFDLYYLLYLL